MAGEEEGRRARPAGGVELLVCMKCGREYQFEGGEEPPSDLKCEKCGGEVFRTFGDDPNPSEAAADFRESTEREVATNDPAEDVTRGDLYDLNNP